ncbi:MAG: hypothetical protein ACD_9C00291G0009 [uncultured bacterium]|nr:MAG: hypothetical protein ACD_9C00291G0009 [uncultured bacterium]
MKNKKIIYYTIGLLVVLVMILAVIIQHGKNSPMTVVFMDVGQGDSILISNGTQQLLIDGGKDGKLLLEKLGKHIPFWDRNIEVVVETHPDQDHIGGLIDVLSAYRVGDIVKTKMQSDSQTFKKLEEEIAKNNLGEIEAKKDLKIKFANNAFAQVLYPFAEVKDINGKDTNSNSVVIKLSVGENKFLFTGDLANDQEKELIENNIDLSAQFLKIAHHGSRYATSDEFLEMVKPIDAIISVGKNNSYGHPNAEVLQRLVNSRVNVLRTDEGGDIIYECQSLGEKCVLKSL